MNITKLPSGNWRARVYTGKVNGRSTYEQFIAPTKKEAEMQAIEFQLELKKNPDLLRQRKLTDEEKEVEKVNATEVKGFGDMTVGEAIDAYINNVEGVLSPSTIRRYRSDRKKFFPGLMDVRLKDLTQPAVQVAVSKDSKKYAAKSIHCAHGLLSAALDVYWPDFQLKTNLPQKVEPDLIIPDSDDVKALLKAIEGTWLEAAVLLGACAGMRRSEICGLKFSDIDLKKSEIHIRRTMLKDKNGKWVVFEKTKTVKSKREVTLPGFIIERLWNMPRDSEFVVNHVPDTIKVQAAVMDPEKRVDYMDMVGDYDFKNNCSTIHMDAVYDGEKLIGASSDRMLSAKTREMISICTIDEDYAVEGKAVEVLWGNPGTCQMRIRAKVTLFPYIKEDRNDNIDIEKIPRPVFD